ncbi:tyrosine-type recombinase/integrase [Tsukamurella sp. DT100]|uniref:tyrosine-type recombinase/integrase n=1 Tax=Tsukamurella sp. DT100 TaxID=3393415 RepID=UPI003CF2833B
MIAKTKTDCMSKLRKLRTDAENGTLAEGGGVTMKWWCEHWLTTIAPRTRQPKALETVRSYTNNHIVPALGRKKLERVTPTDVLHLTEMLVSPKSAGGKGLKTGTALNVHWTLSAILDSAVSQGRIPANVVKRVDPPRVVREERAPLTLNQAQMVLRHLGEKVDAAENDKARGEAAAALSRWATAMFTGARQEDLLGMEWDRIDLEAGTMDVSWALQWQKLKPDVHPQGVVYPRSVFAVAPGVLLRPIWKTACLVETKTKRSRVVPLIDPLVEVLRTHRELSGGRGLVWTRDGGRPLRRQDDTSAWNQLCAELGIEGVKQHGLRHTAATLLLEAGVTEDVRMQILGHSTAAAHRMYAHVSQEQTRAALEGTFGKMLDR